MVQLSISLSAVAAQKSNCTFCATSFCGLRKLQAARKEAVEQMR